MSAIYPAGFAAIFNGTKNLIADPIRAVLVSGDYVYDSDHLTLADIPSPTRVRVLNQLTGKSITAQGSFDAADITVAGIPSGNQIAAIVLYFEGGTEDTSTLICWLNEGPEFPLLTTGTDVTIQWPNTPERIFRISYPS